jgi:hypothetical protein
MATKMAQQTDITINSGVSLSSVEFHGQNGSNPANNPADAPSVSPKASPLAGKSVATTISGTDRVAVRFANPAIVIF